MNHPRRRIRGRLTITRPAHPAGDDAQAIARARDVPTGAAQPSLNTRPRCRRRPPGSPLPATRFPTQWLPAHQAPSQKGISHDVPHQPNRPRLVELRAPSPVKRRGTSILLYLASLRQAVGNSFRNGVLATQNAGNELVRVDLTSPGDHTIWLWFTPNNLYVRGVTAAGGTTCMFNEPSVTLPACKGSTTSAMFKRRGGDSHGPTEFRQQHGRLVPHRAVTPIAE